MSITICKQIGLFLSKTRANDVLVSDAIDRLEAAAEESTLFDDLVEFVQSAMSENPELTTTERVILTHNAKKLVANHSEGSLEAWELVQNIISHDQHKGFLFCNLENVRQGRRGSRIDLLERSGNPQDWAFNARSLQAPAHSWGGYRPVGPIAPDLAAHLEEGIRLSGDLAELVIQSMETVAHPPELRRERAIERFNQHFRPEVDPICSMLATKLGLIKGGVSISDFEKALVPSILTTWL